MSDERDTDPAPFQPEEEEVDQHEEAKAVRRKQLETMDAHALLVSLHLRLDEVDVWRAKTDRRLAEGDAEIGMCLESVRVLCEIRGAENAAEQLGKYLEEKRARNGAFADRDSPTNPGNERPDADAE